MVVGEAGSPLSGIASPLGGWSVSWTPEFWHSVSACDRVCSGEFPGASSTVCGVEVGMLVELYVAGMSVMTADPMISFDGSSGTSRTGGERPKSGRWCACEDGSSSGEAELSL